MDMKNTLIHHFLESAAALFPGKEACMQDDRRMSFREVNSRANELARFLMMLGIKKGDRVAILFENCPEFIIGYYAVLKAGAVVSPLSTDLKPGGLAEILETLQPAVIIFSRRFDGVLSLADHPLVRKSKLIVQSPESVWRENGYDAFGWPAHNETGCMENPAVHISGDSLANIIFTSGSTGVPKGVMLSHANIVSNTRSICEYLRLSDKDRHMVVLPFFYVMGLSLLNTHFAACGSLVINNKFAYPATVVEQMSRESVTGFSGVPSTFACLLHRSPLAGYKDRLSSLRYCAQAGGHMPNQVKKELRKTLPEHTDIYIMYGATEASARLSYLEPQRFADKMGSIGRAIPGVSLRVLDAYGREVQTGQTGEIVASGPNIMLGYWNDRNSTTRVLDKHGYHTGDIGYRDEDGYFFIQGRNDKLLKIGGHRINPQEIEDAVLDTGLAIEVAVIGQPDELLGNRLVAMVVTGDPDTDEKTLLSACSEILPKYKLPAEIKLLKSLPKKSSGKTDYSKIHEIYGQYNHAQDLETVA